MKSNNIGAQDASREQVWEKVRSIRSSWKDPSQLESLLAQWDQEYGSRYNELAIELITDQTRKYWAKIADNEGKNDLDALMGVLWHNWDEGKYSVTENADGVQIHCTMCPIAEAFQSIGRQQEGLLFMCSEDPAIVEGFNPDIEFQRTKTLMNGDDCCNHRYSQKKAIDTS
ncbi:MAG: L-2-amino-thiazoline-4-carboxylic acid hydrolase [Candidatus Heimdallarchaeota archaeon]